MSNNVHKKCNFMNSSQYEYVLIWIKLVLIVAQNSECYHKDLKAS